MINLKDTQNYPVVKSNALIEAKYKLSLNEQKIMYILISQIKPDDEIFKIYSIKIKKLMDILGIENKTYYSVLRELLRGLKKKEIIIENLKFKGHFLDMNWLASAEYVGDGVIEIEISQKLKPYLLQLKTHFTVLELDRILKLN